MDVYPDRVEITSPGGLWGGITPANIDEGVSRSRNDTLAKLLTRVPLTGGNEMVCENQGSGVPRMIGAMRERGLPVPEFRDSIDAVQVVLHRFGLLTPDTRAWLNDQTDKPLSPHEQIALVLAQAQGKVTPQELRQQLGVDTDDARTDLERLAQLGLLVRASVDTFQLSAAQPSLPWDFSAGELDVLNALSTKEPTSIQHLADRTGRGLSGLRVILRALVAAGLVLATAPPTSRNRAYVRAIS